MIVVDSSVWIAQLRSETHASVRRFQALVQDDDDQVLPVILLKVLQGARDEAHAARIERSLRSFPIASMLDETVAVQAAKNYRLLLPRGRTVRKTIDMISGAFCLVGGHVLLHDDWDCEPLAEHLGLVSAQCCVGGGGAALGKVRFARGNLRARMATPTTSRSLMP